MTPEGELGWNKASKLDLTLTVKCSEAVDACFEYFTDVKLDGKLLERDKDYTAAPGSTIVTLKAETLTASGQKTAWKTPEGFAFWGSVPCRSCGDDQARHQSR